MMDEQSKEKQKPSTQPYPNDLKAVSAMPCCDVISAGPSAKSLGARALPQPMGTLLRQSLRLQGCCHETHRASGKTLFPRNVTLPTRTRIDNPGWPVAQQTHGAQRRGRQERIRR
ncbi:unnamed protein product [Arctogadus glacialis]